MNKCWLIEWVDTHLSEAHWHAMTDTVIYMFFSTINQVFVDNGKLFGTKLKNSEHNQH